MEKQTWRTDLWTQRVGRRERVSYMERATWKLTIPHVKQIANGNLMYDPENSNWGSATGGVGKEMGGRSGREGKWVYLLLILVEYDRKPQNSVKQLSFN